MTEIRLDKNMTVSARTHWEPTGELRWLRTETKQAYILTLQQAWLETYSGKTEWRNVETVDG